MFIRFKQIFKAGRRKRLSKLDAFMRQNRWQKNQLADFVENKFNL